MSMYTSIAATVSKSITQYGTQVTIKRLNTTLGMTTGVFASSQTTNISGDAGSQITSTNTTQKVLYVPGNLTFEIRNGDLVFCSLGTFKIKEVDEVNPAGSRLLYKLMVT